jgi:hypothetical protein
MKRWQCVPTLQTEDREMTAIRIETLLEGETLFLPQLKPLVGKSVEIVVTELPTGQTTSGYENWTSPLAGTVLSYLGPCEPAASSDEWEASR